MKRNSIILFLFLLPSSVFGLAGNPSTDGGKPAAYRHAYYLFLADTPRGCEDCYVPLLITTDSLEDVAKGPTKVACVLIITYERDSIWHNDGTLFLSPGDIEAAPRIVHLRGRKYRYQEISSAETLRLLENPMGTIPISRPLSLNASAPGPTLEDLILAFRGST